MVARLEHLIFGLYPSESGGGLQSSRRSSEDMVMSPERGACLVTGAARRVGRSVALELAEAGFDVAIHYGRSAADARELADQIRSRGRQAVLIQGDLADPSTPERVVHEAAAALGGLHVLVNSASVFEKASLEETDLAMWERALRVNLVAPAMLIRAAARIMRTAGGGRVVNITDILADRPAARHAAYCASKAALAGLTRCLALELAPDITVNAVAPGIAVFPEHYDQETQERLTSKVPLKRPGTPQDVAAAVRFLAVEGGYLTGQIINVDGGWSVGR
jgi:pteridine reductase